MIKNLYIVVILLLLVSCSSADYVGEIKPGTDNGGPISFRSNADMVTRADSKGLEDYLPNGNKTILLNGVKGIASTPAEWQDVFENYVLTWQANTAGTSSSNSSDWEYVGGTSLHSTPATQTIKYWDYSADPYVFCAVAPKSNAGVKNENSKTITYTSPNITIANFATAPFYYTQPQEVSKSFYDQTVNLRFRSVASKVRVGLYETIPGYEITNIKFYESSTATDFVTAPTLFTTGSQFCDEGSYTVVGNYDNSETQVNLIPTDDANKRSFLHVGKTGDEGNIVTSALGTTSTAASFGKTDNNGYIYAFSDESHSRQLSIKCDYTLKSLSAGSDEVIEIKGQTAVVPAQYGTWRPNYAYTYLFKITDDGSGLYPISFEACVETWADNSDGTVTIVQKPSITTSQDGSVNPGDTDQDVHYVLNKAINVDVSLTDVPGTALEYLYYGPQVTEGEFEYLDKRNSYSWTSLDEISAPNYLHGTFIPDKGGYYAVRFTYTLNANTYYAYKIVKVGEYSFLEPALQIDDDYQHGIVIE